MSKIDQQQQQRDFSETSHCNKSRGCAFEAPRQSRTATEKSEKWSPLFGRRAAVRRFGVFAAVRRPQDLAHGMSHVLGPRPDCTPARYVELFAACGAARRRCTQVLRLDAQGYTLPPVIKTANLIFKGADPSA